MQNDTITSIATPPGEGGISIIRVSGPRALDIADKVFKCQAPKPSARPANSFVHGYVRSPALKESETKYDIDEAILLIYRAPHSYTREDVIEIQGHGGTICSSRILRAVLSAGARQAEPGEFTKRAFLAGRIDLLQAEAVMDLIKARSDRAATAALEQLEGSLSNKFTEIYDQLMSVAADLEATLDFEVDELSENVVKDIIHRLNSLYMNILQLIESWDEGHLLRDGAIVVLSGKPNAGKSTIMNALLDRERAIVTQTPGTTRDTLEEQIIIDGIPIRLIDTAGIRETECNIEQESIKRAREKMKQADITIWVIDGSNDVDQHEIKYIMSLNNNKLIVVINKSDLSLKLSKQMFKGVECVICGLGNTLGINVLKQAISKKLINSPPQHHATISERHRRILLRVVDDIQQVMGLVSSGNEEQFVPAAGILRDTLEALDEITGRTYHENLLDTIFGKFCIGK